MIRLESHGKMIESHGHTEPRCLGDAITCADNIEKALSPIVALGATVALASAIVIGCIGSGAMLCGELIVLAGPGVLAGLYATYRLADAVWFGKGHDKAYHPLGGHREARRATYEPGC